MKSAVTVSLVPEARGGPFVFWDDVAAAARQAADLGFDALEVFPPDPHAVDAGELRDVLSDTGLSLAAVGTGAGWVVHKLTLTSPDRDTRARAFAFAESLIEFAAGFGAPVIIGSMQGRVWEGAARESALGMLADGLGRLARRAAQLGASVLYEPLNRYETNLVNTLADGVKLLAGVENVKLLADLYHMNIEEANLPASIRATAGRVGHVHFADSNRRAAGMGHTDFGPVVAALRETGYTGYLSAEVLPLPDPVAAARQTIASFRQYAGTRS